MNKLKYTLLLLICTLFFSSCKKCWECEFQYYKTSYTKGSNTVIVEAKGTGADYDSLLKYQNMGYTYDSLLEYKPSMKEEYCGTKKEMELDINENNINGNKSCYPVK
jgi:hypothetical protein